MNNEYVIMFKRGVFELAETIVPVAIKYNKMFVDAYWNSREHSFPRHLLQLMSSWAVVCDVHYLDPHKRLEGESATQFAERVKLAICKASGLKPVPWDGYLKYYRPKPSALEDRRKIFARHLMRRFSEECLRRARVKALLTASSAPLPGADDDEADEDGATGAGFELSRSASGVGAVPEQLEEKLASTRLRAGLGHGVRRRVRSTAA